MALPTLNTAKYELTLPSNGKKIEYRPFLMKEEKVLLMAVESNDIAAISKATRDLVEACTFNKVNIKDLAFFDLEYLFLQLRSKSVGESAGFKLKCKECEAQNEVQVNLSGIEVKKADKVENKIMLSDDVGVLMKFPTVGDLEHVMNGIDDSHGDAAIAIMAAAIESIFDNDSVYPAKDHKAEELIDFIEQLNKEQFIEIQKFFEQIPKVTEDVHFDCNKCGTSNDIKLEGLQDFFG